MAGTNPAMTQEETIMTEIRVPTLGESVTEATIGKWFKKPGDAVAVDEPLGGARDRQGDDRGAGARRRRARRHRRQGRRDGRRRRAARPDHDGAGGAKPAAAAAPRRRPPRLLQPRRAPAAKAAAPMRRWRRRCASCPPKAASMPRRCRQRQGRPRDQGRHAGRDREGRSAADAGHQPAAAVQVRAPSPADDASREERVR